MSQEPDLSLIGKVLDDRYEILEVIGGGGVGAVYSARRVQLDRMVAVKVLHESLVGDAGFVGRFRREAVAMSRLHHPHCLSVIDSGVYETRPYLVLEYVPGQTVSTLLEQGPFTPARAVDIALQLLDTLEYFHDHHVIHRDLKSENVMLVEASGTTDFVKVLDFGMAKILTGPGADSQLSKIGIVPGTPSAMAPEQIYQLPPDPRIDIYATGILLYEMIVGRRPFKGADMAATIKLQLSAPPKAPREVLGQDALSTELEQVVMRALEKDRIDRYGTAAEMAAALRLTPEGHASVPPAAANVQPLSGAQPERRTRGPGLWLAGGGLVLGACAAAFAAVQLSAAAPPPVAPPVVRSASAAPSPPPVMPPPAPVIETWLAHRDLAATYAARGQHDAAFREVRAAVADNPALARVDSALARFAVNALDAQRVAFVVETFRESTELPFALEEASASGMTFELRHAALEGLRRLGHQARADLVAMAILDVQQASSCTEMRQRYKPLRGSKDPRVAELKSEIRKRGRSDPHLRCLRRVLRH